MLPDATCAGLLQVELDSQWQDLTTVTFLAVVNGFPQDAAPNQAVAIDNMCISVKAPTGVYGLGNIRCCRESPKKCFPLSGAFRGKIGISWGKLMLHSEQPPSINISNADISTTSRHVHKTGFTRFSQAALALSPEVPMFSGSTSG